MSDWQPATKLAKVIGCATQSLYTAEKTGTPIRGFMVERMEAVYHERHKPKTGRRARYLYRIVTPTEVEDAPQKAEVTNLVWTKDRWGLGQYFHGQHELCLFAVRGDHCPTEGTWSTWLGQSVLKRTEHSKKPTEIHELIEQASPGLWLEMFARQARPGWLSFGNEL